MSLVEEVLSGSLTVIRVISFLYRSGGATLYKIRKETGIAVRRETLEKLVGLGVLEKNPHLGTYRLNAKNRFVVEFLKFLRAVGYLE